MYQIIINKIDQGIQLDNHGNNQTHKIRFINLNKDFMKTLINNLKAKITIKYPTDI